MNEQQPVSQLVVVGASAGGIDALPVLLGSLSADFPAPVVIAQHLDPTRPSRLAEILAQQSALPIRLVEDSEPLRNGTVYVVPSNRDVEITNHQVSVRTGRTSRSAPSIDHLLATAAQAFGEDLIAVILAGLGSDGAMGARVVKQVGGTVVVQNPATATFRALPSSLAPNTVDVSANLDAIGSLLESLLADASDRITSDDDRALQSLLVQLRNRSGLDFTSYKMPTIRRRLQRRMAAVGHLTLPEYARYLQKQPDEYQRLINSFLIKVTEFFRDPDLFHFLRQTLLPELIAQARDGSHELRIWSAGCATGEEAYSLAILLSDLLGEDIDQFSVRVFATDLDNEAVAFARRGIYPARALTDVPVDLLSRYFDRIGDEYEVKKHVRNLVVFGPHDLGQRAPFPRIDLTLCRNVLIYFTPELQKRALQLFAFSLRDGGYLALGKAETTSPLPGSSRSNTPT